MAPFFEPHAVCYAGDAAVIWSFVISDVFIWLAYMIISTRILWLFLRKQVPRRGIFAGFFLFINLCGWTHLWHAVGVFRPDFISGAVINVITALASLVVAVFVAAAEFDFPRISQEFQAEHGRVTQFYADLKEQQDSGETLRKKTQHRIESMLKKLG